MQRDVVLDCEWKQGGRDRPPPIRKSGATPLTGGPSHGSRGLVRPGVDHASEAFGFVRAHQAMYPVSMMCRVLEVSRSGYYAWLRREPCARARANAILLETIERVHKESDGTYGSPRMHAKLPDHGLQASLNRVARIMRVAGLQGVSRRRGVRTTWRSKEDAPAGDLVNRTFTATGPNQLWVADITYIPTCAGFLYLAVVPSALGG